jgi:hypothetical protein
MIDYNKKLNEFKALKLKCKPSKGYMQGLNSKEYHRINSLHSFLLSTLKGKTSDEKKDFFNKL